MKNFFKNAVQEMHFGNCAGYNSLKGKDIAVVGTYHIRNVAYLHNHVVILDGIAVVGTNGWYNPTFDNILLSAEELEIERYEDIGYLGNSLERLQLHLDVKKIVIVSHSVPGPELFFGEKPENINELPPPQTALINDSESKVSHWLYGHYNKTVDTTIDGINYINNSYYKRRPYWAKRVEI
jgi:predicted phosphohydrolase